MKHDILFFCLGFFSCIGAMALIVARHSGHFKRFGDVFEATKDEPKILPIKEEELYLN